MVTHVWLLALEDGNGQTLWGACATEKGILEAAEKVRASYKGEWVLDRPTRLLLGPPPPPYWLNQKAGANLRVLRFPIREDIIDLLADLTRKT